MEHHTDNPMNNRGHREYCSSIRRGKQFDHARKRVDHSDDVLITVGIRRKGPDGIHADSIHDGISRGRERMHLDGVL